MKSFRIKFWGVRGSIPTPGSSTLIYGGNTPCVEIKFAEGPLFILDAGTGIRELGKNLVKVKQAVKAYIFISHFHWDHIQGLPFFRPAFNPNNDFTILGSDDAAIKLDQIISFQMDPTYFPITIEDMLANIKFRSIREENLEIEGVDIQTIYLNHPGYALGFRFSFKGKSLIYISDNEPFHYKSQSNEIDGESESDNLEDLFDSFIENKDKNLINFCKNADILIHDTQFFPDEYKEKVTWGHSPFNYTVDLAIKSKVKNLILFHHDPDHDDDNINRIQSLSQELIQKSKQMIVCQAAREGMELIV
jgi:phosphoribosyl 1,2-cyclic phosphodiesterase